MVLTLIGYRGCGKTTVAGPLAARLGWRWIDADVELERRAGRTIREIFAAEGEPAFRALEKALLAELLAEDRLVIAAGGGAVLDPETRARLRAAGPVVWLQAPVEVLAARIAGDVTTQARRPNLTALGGTAEIAGLLAQREPIYRSCATLIVSSADLDPEAIVARIVAELPDRPAER